MTARVLMVQGASSSAGKSLLVTALCRICARRGVRVAPFKAQNMSNNAAVCADGAEIGRAQAVQAAAAGIEPTADMNPILLKPEADARSQVIVLGHAWHTLAARDYYQHKDKLWSIVTAALARLRASYDAVIIEGAGSPVELNLRASDITNMAVALHACAPVLLVGDIDRGGIFAQLLGSLWLFEPAERALVRGLVVNKFRGDPTLFADGVHILEQRGGVPVLGVIPYLPNLAVPEEDAVALEMASGSRYLAGDGREAAGSVEIAVVRLPRIANFDDFDPLAAEPGVRLRYVSSTEELGQPQAVIIPGTKSTVADLRWLRAQGLADAIHRLADEGTAVVGICGGYQMLGQVIRDPDQVESPAQAVAALGLLPVETVFEADKATYQARARVLGGPGWLSALAGQSVQGYEIHMGHSQGADAWLMITERNRQSLRVADGAVSGDGRVWGCYLHGLFANERLRRAWLSSLGWRGGDEHGHVTSPAAAFDRLANAVENALDMTRLEAILWGD